MKTNSFTMMTAALTFAATAGFAQTAMDTSNLISADQLGEGDIYRMEVTDVEAWDTGRGFAEIDAEWVKVGDIEDILLDRDGKLVGVLVEIGGFLDIGDRDVIVPVKNVRLSVGGEREYNLVTNMHEAELEALPEVDENIRD